MRPARQTLLCLALLGAAIGTPALAQDHAAHDMASHGMPAHDMPSHGMFAMMDADGDGRVSAAEHATAAQAMFDEADANHDGAIGHEEMMAAHAPSHPGMAGHAMKDGKKAGCCCCGGGEGGMQACGMGDKDKKDPIGEAMSGQ